MIFSFKKQVISTHFEIKKSLGLSQKPTFCFCLSTASCAAPLILLGMESIWPIHMDFHLKASNSSSLRAPIT